jgi:putative membrane protein
MMGIGFLFFVFFAIVVIAGGLGLGKFVISNNSPLANIFSTNRKNTPREIIEERYARGEITREEFELMKTDIE